MAMREFTDGDGTTWKVWSTVPYTRGVMRGMQSGWLTFEAGNTRRRLMPIPLNWEDASVVELRVYCGKAELVRPTPSAGTLRIENTDR